jgi:hypothetical protein
MNTNVAICESVPMTVPAKRQMNGLYALKPWSTRRLTFVVDSAVAHHVSPDVFTAAGVAAAGAAGVAISSRRASARPILSQGPAASQPRRVHFSLPGKLRFQTR